MKLLKDYFDVKAPTFWRLTDDAIEWQGAGKTLAVREAVIATLEALKPTGIPEAEALMVYFSLFQHGWYVLKNYAESELENSILTPADWERLRQRATCYDELEDRCEDLAHWKVALARITFESAGRADLRWTHDRLEDNPQFWGARGRSSQQAGCSSSFPEGDPMCAFRSAAGNPGDDRGSPQGWSGSRSFTARPENRSRGRGRL